jgi:hypothetical protein
MKFVHNNPYTNLAILQALFGQSNLRSLIMEAWGWRVSGHSKDYRVTKTQKKALNFLLHVYLSPFYIGKWESGKVGKWERFHCASVWVKLNV